MRKMARGFLAVVAGFIVASVVMMLIESINGHALYPEMGKAAEGVTDRETLRAVLASAPLGALLVVLFGWVLGSLAGGFVAARLVKGSPSAHALALGGLLTLAGVANNLMLPPPAWFWIPTLLLFLPFVYAGARLAPRREAAES